MQQGYEFSTTAKKSVPLGALRADGHQRHIAGHSCCLFQRGQSADDLPASSCPECKRQSGADSARAVRTALADWL